MVSAILPPDPGGLGETVWAKHQWLRARGVDARVVTYSARVARRAGDEPLPAPEIVRYDAMARVGGSPLQKLRDVRAMAHILQEALADRDLIEIQGWTLWNAALALLPGPLARKPWIMVYRGTDGWAYRPRAIFDLRRSMNRRATTLANSLGLAAHLREKGLRVDAHIWSEVDPALFQAPDAPPEPDLIVTVKGLYPLGDPETLVRALGILKQQGIPFRHVHVGGGPLEGEMRRLCNALGIADRVTFLGTIPHGDLPPILARAAVKVLPSRVESCPHVVGEAMMMARPVVATATT
ncbi:MAG: hypothetical protein A2Y95_00875, partial [Deltaproteobacteria bacterium RBG_13_65_10]